MSAPHTLDISQLGVTAAPAEGQLIYQAPSQWQQSDFTPSTHRSSHMHVIPKMADDFSSIAGFMHNGAHVDVAVPMMSTNTIPSMNTRFYSNFEDQYNSNMFQDTQSYNPTQANGLSAMPEILGSGFSPYSQSRYVCCRRYMINSFAHGVLEYALPVAILLVMAHINRSRIPPITSQGLILVCALSQTSTWYLHLRLSSHILTCNNDQTPPTIPYQFIHVRVLNQALQCHVRLPLLCSSPACNNSGTLLTTPCRLIHIHTLG